jgi:hypothetical protein
MERSVNGCSHRFLAGCYTEEELRYIQHHLVLTLAYLMEEAGAIAARWLRAKVSLKRNHV